MTITNYLTAINSRLATGRAREHAYRGDLQALLEQILPATHTVVNEPSQVRGVGNPDFLIRNANGVAVGYIEAKDITKDLDDKSYSEQFDRYRKGLDNLIITDYLRFDFYQSGKLVHRVTIGELQEDLKSMVLPEENEYDRFDNLIRDFGSYQGEPIRSPKRLADLMAGKARLLQDILHRAVEADIEVDNRSDLRGQYDSFKSVLLHDLDSKQFSDLYAQTLAYGLFAARLHDESLDSFSRQEAGDLIPKSNPFLRQLFGYVAGFNIDSRIEPTVNNLADIFLLADVKSLMTGYGKATAQEDPVVHFYETFLAEYDPKLRKQRGVWYTPQPVVDFIVRAVDDLLKSEFGLKDGLADNSKIKVKRKVTTKATADRRSKLKEREYEEEVHRVQVLDPATGTGTFLATAIKYIFERNFEMMPGAWPDYVEEHLIPRLNGFELLMASYAMAHLKLDLTLRDTGYTRELGKRFNVYLTNALEEDHPDTGTLFANFLSSEANEANAIKRDTPVMVVMGNPPYSVSSSNKGKYIQSLIEDYKKNLNERKINLDDDYIKFIRLGQELIHRTGEGILVYISNNSFIDGITHRSMRKSLLDTFDRIWIMDLHGNSRKLEAAEDGAVDENVFDIMQGVSINIFVKHRVRAKANALYHVDLYGDRAEKYSALDNSSINGIKFAFLSPQEPYYFFTPKDFTGIINYKEGFKISDLFNVSNAGIQTKRDDFVYAHSASELNSKVADLKCKEDDEVKALYGLKDSVGWNVAAAKSDIEGGFQTVQVAYRPFDMRYAPFTGNSSGIMGRPRTPASGHMLLQNLSLLAVRNSRRGNYNSYFVANKLVDKDGISPFDNCKFFPIYTYSRKWQYSLDLSRQAEQRKNLKREPNFDRKILSTIAAGVGLTFTPEKEDTPCTFAPIDLLDYIYAVLHDPDYRETYAEFLKIDFPRVPYPDDVQKFWGLVKLGGELRRIHLLEHPVVDDKLVSFHGKGDNTVTRKLTKRSPGWVADDDDATVGKVYISDEQYFAGVPSAAYECYIGGYQPAQKWLKDRRDRKLSYDDVRHYLRIVKALVETMRLMEELRGKVLA